MIKKEKKKQKILSQISELLHQNSNLNASEKEILIEYQDRIQETKNIEFELVHFRNALLPLVISSNLSQPVLNFYKELRAERKITWGEGSSLITGLSQLPSQRK